MIWDELLTWYRGSIRVLVLLEVTYRTNVTSPSGRGRGFSRGRGDPSLRFSVATVARRWSGIAKLGRLAINPRSDERSYKRGKLRL